MPGTATAHVDDSPMSDAGSQSGVRDHATSDARRSSDVGEGPAGDGDRRTDEGKTKKALWGRKAAFLIVLLMVGVGCSASTQKGPLHDSTMVDLLIELHLAAARAEATNEIPPNIRDSILIAYGVDSTTYADAITFYAERPEKYLEIYSRVLDRLNSERNPLGGDVQRDRNAEATPSRSSR